MADAVVDLTEDASTMTTTQPITPSDSLAKLAASRAGASRVFHRYGLDFCCHGSVSLASACAQEQLEVGRVIAEIEAEAGGDGGIERWSEWPVPELIDRIVAHFHEAHRRELPRLIEMARTVERVHAGKTTRPTGLADHLDLMRDALELHMQKEEQALFPLLRAGHGRMAAAPISVMEREHEDHARHLARLRALTNGHRPPEGACATWRGLYLGLADLERALMEHIHVENNVLFPRALRGGDAGLP